MRSDGPFGVTAAAVRQLLHDYPLATVVVHRDGQFHASPVPLYHADDDTLLGHLPRIDPIHRLLVNGGQALAIFRGPESYMPGHAFDPRQIPTYDFATCHCHLTVQLDHTPQRVLDLLERQIAQLEPNPSNRWSLDELTPSMRDRLVAQLSMIEARIDRIEHRFKLGQDKPTDMRQQRHAWLKQQQKHELAAWMSRYITAESDGLLEGPSGA